MSNPINNTVFDSRDLLEYRDELAENIIYLYNECMSEANEDWEDVDDIEDVNFEALNNIDDYQDEVEHYIDISKFCDDISEYCSDFEYGVAIMHEDYFEEYCEELVKEIGDLSKNLPAYIENNIDWSGVADDLKVDYSEAEYDGNTYYFR
jgi:hypothetical protein